MKKGQVVIARRDNGEKLVVKEENLTQTVKMLLKEIQENLFNQAKKFLNENIREAADYDEFKEIIEEKKGMIKAYWCGDRNCEDKVKEETKASIRCIPFEQEEAQGKCIYCGKQTSTKVYFARAY